mmetsp:Transcript_63066/g.173056  ORF Transcript_63066/g.173056 Transcript_63066/m.173056 type:complete len:208 (-) Transcript_63066:2174-2797(-)
MEGQPVLAIPGGLLLGYRNDDGGRLRRHLRSKQRRTTLCHRHAACRCDMFRFHHRHSVSHPGDVRPVRNGQAGAAGGDDALCAREAAHGGPAATNATPRELHLYADHRLQGEVSDAVPPGPRAMEAHLLHAPPRVPLAHDQPQAGRALGDDAGSSSAASAGRRQRRHRLPQRCRRGLLFRSQRHLPRHTRREKYTHAGRRIPRRQRL